MAGITFKSFVLQFLYTTYHKLEKNTFAASQNSEFNSHRSNPNVKCIFSRMNCFVTNLCMLGFISTIFNIF